MGSHRVPPKIPLDHNQISHEYPMDAPWIPYEYPMNSLWIRTGVQMFGDDSTPSQMVGSRVWVFRAILTVLCKFEKVCVDDSTPSQALSSCSEIWPSVGWWHYSQSVSPIFVYLKISTFWWWQYSQSDGGQQSLSIWLPVSQSDFGFSQNLNFLVMTLLPVRW